MNNNFLEDVLKILTKVNKNVSVDRFLFVKKILQNC